MIISELESEPPALLASPESVSTASPGAARTQNHSTSLHSLLSLSPSSPRLLSALQSYSHTRSVTIPEIKSFSDSVYFTYADLGLSLIFQPRPRSGYKLRAGLGRTELEDERLKLMSIDVYNSEATLEDPSTATSTSLSKTTKWGQFKAYPLVVQYPLVDGGGVGEMEILEETRGKEFTTVLGEPDRKGTILPSSSTLDHSVLTVHLLPGGGEGSIGIWTEWTSLGLMVEFASGGLQAWDKGGDSLWKVVTIFERGVESGIDEGDQEGTGAF